MPFFPIVNPSDKVRHSARRENALTELLNRNGMMTPGKSFRFGVRTLRMPVYNSGAATLPAGAVAFGPNNGFQEDAIPVIALSDPDALYGILTEPLEPNAYGDAIVAGVAAVRLSAALPAGTKFVEPGDGGSFKAASGGRAQVIASQGNTALVLLGGAGAGASDLGVLVSGPSGGYGPAVWRAITVNPDGTWTATGEEVPVIVPLLK